MASWWDFLFGQDALNKAANGQPQPYTSPTGPSPINMQEEAAKAAARANAPRFPLVGRPAAPTVPPAQPPAPAVPPNKRSGLDPRRMGRNGMPDISDPTLNAFTDAAMESMDPAQYVQLARAFAQHPIDTTQAVGTGLYEGVKGMLDHVPTGPELGGLLGAAVVPMPKLGRAGKLAKAARMVEEAAPVVKAAEEAGALSKAVQSINSAKTSVKQIPALLKQAAPAPPAGLIDAAPAVHTGGPLLWEPGMPLSDIDAKRLNIPKKGKKLSVPEVGRYLEERTRAKYGAVPHDASFDAKYNRAMELSVPEFRDQLSQPNPNTDFYSVDTPNSDLVLAQLFPELASDPTKHNLQKAFSAVLSNNSKPNAEAFHGARLWEDYIKNPGQIPMRQPSGKHWPAQGAAIQLDKMQQMLNDLGEEGLIKFLNSPQTIRDIRKYRPKMKGKMNAIVPGSEVLGNKIGHYYGDLLGLPDTSGRTTVDKWDMRRSSRQRGLLFDDVKGKPKMIETPRTELDREVNMKTHRALAEMFGLPEARDAQSGQWFYEQDLWRRLGIPVQSTKRSDGIARYAKQRGLLGQ